jgi:dipeptidyl-peptidase-4
MKTATLLLLFVWLLQTRAVAAAPEDPPEQAPLDTRFLRDYAETRGFMLGRPVKAKPTPDGKFVLFLRAEARKARMNLFDFEVATGKARLLLTPEKLLEGGEERLSPEEKARRERMRVSVGGFTDFQLSEDGSKILLSLSGKLYVISRGEATVRALKTGPGTLLDPKFAPDGKQVSYVLDHDLYVYDLGSDKERRLTQGGTERLTHGLAEFVAQEEMYRYTGYWWSPDSRFVIYEEADAEGVEIWYVADPARPDNPPRTSYYPRPGHNNVKVRLGVLPAAGGETTWINWDRKIYPYVGQVHWDKNGPPTVIAQTRDQKELVLFKVDPATGATTPLVIENDRAWVNLPLDVPRWLSDGKRFLWISERDGGPQLELRNEGRKLPWVLVPPTAGFQAVIDLDAEKGLVVYRASTDPTQSQLFRVSVANPEPEPLSKGAGIHTAVFSRNHAVFVHNLAAFDAMPATTVHSADGSLLGTLPAVAEAPPFGPRSRLLKVGEEPGFYAAVVRPRAFDAKKRYPVLVDVYGGPHHNKVLTPMNTRLLDQWLADQGFIVVSIDGRGTPGRGREWERAIYHKFGSVPLADQAAGLEALASNFPEMDVERVGIFGWSFGGYMSALAVLRRPDLYKAAVAGAPVTDWFDYDTHYTERYLGVLVEGEPAPVYAEASLLTYAEQLSRPLLLIHGTADDNVYFRHTLRLTDALFRAGKEFELLPLSGLTHMVPQPLVNERLWSRVVTHFRKHLGAPVAVEGK